MHSRQKCPEIDRNSPKNTHFCQKMKDFEQILQEIGPKQPISIDFGPKKMDVVSSKSPGNRGISEKMRYILHISSKKRQ